MTKPKDFKNKKFTSNYYKLENPHHIYITKRINEILKGFTPKKVLDLGGGNGEYSSIFPNTEYIGVDCVDEQIRRMRSKGLKAFKLDLEKKIPFKDNSFDLILLMDTIEHIYNNFLLIKEVRRILIKHGRLIITVPNISSLYNRLNLLRGYKPANIDSFRYDDNSDLKYGEDHINVFTKNELKLILEKNKLKLLTIQGLNSGILGRNLFDKFLVGLSSSLILCGEKSN